VSNRRKVGTTSSPHGLYVQGYTRATMVGTKGCNPVRVSQSQKTDLSSDRSLQLDSVKLESLVIPDQHAGVNTFPGLVHTARHTTKVGCTRSAWANRTEVGGRRSEVRDPRSDLRFPISVRRQRTKVWSVIGVKS
jgi:hypothetical protein